MKKLSLMLVLAMVLAMIFAISVFADGETFVIGTDQIASVTVTPEDSGTTWGEPEQLFDGNSTCDGGWISNDWTGWAGDGASGKGSTATIEFDKEYLVVSAQLYAWTNNNPGVTIKFLDASGKSTSTTVAYGWQQHLDGTPLNLSGTNFKAKSVVINYPGGVKYNWGYLYRLTEIVVNAQELPPCTHDIGTCMETFEIVQNATCTSPATIKYTCTNCKEVITTSPSFDDVTDKGDQSTIATNGSGGNQSGPYSLFDNNLDTYLHASGGWYVESSINLDLNYYLNSVTVWVGAYNDHSSNGAYATISYKAPKADDWTVAGTMQTPVELGGSVKYVYTYVFEQPVLASAVKIRVDGLASYSGQAFEAKVAGSLVASAGKLDHTWVKGETVAPTCVAVGYTNYSCSACEATKIDDIVAVDKVEGHTGGTATCTAKAVCSLCLKEYGEFGNHTYTNTIACITNKCVVCGYVNADVAAEKPHTYGWNIGTNENGEQMHGCSVCKTEAVRDKDNNNISTNLGFTIFYAQSAKDLTKTGYDVIRLCVDFSYKDTLSIKDPNVLIDFGGHSYTKTGSRFNLQQVKGLVNGTIYQNHGLYAIRVYCAGFIEDFDIVVDASYNDNASGIYMWYDASYGGSSLGYMKNVTIDSVRDDNGNYKEGRGLFNHGIEFSNTNSVIGTLENVKVYSRGQALTLYAKSIGKMTNCTFDGTNIALAIGNLQCNVELENCVVNSEVLAIYIEKASAGTKFEFDEKTTISSSGTAFYILPTGEEYDFSDLTSAVALVDGKLYTSFDAALAALKASTAKTTTFTLIGNLELNAPIVIDKKVEFSLGGGKFKVPIINTKNFNEYDAPGYVLTASADGAFTVKEGGSLTIAGDKGTLVGGENAIVVEEGGSALIVAGTYDGFNPQNYMSSDSCYDIKDGKYTITKNHTYSEELLYGILYRADGDCNNCGFIRGVARVGELYYATIEEAIAAAVAYNATVGEDEDKVSVELATNVDLEKSVVVSDVVKIVLNGKTISASKDTVGDGVFHVVAGGELTIADHTQYFTGTVNGVCASEYDMAVWVEGGKVIIEAGIFTNVGAGDDDQYDLIYVKGGELEIKGGTFLAQTPKWTLNLSDNVPGTITVTGGTFPAGFNPGATETEPKNANNDFIPYDYYLNAEGVVVSCGHSYVESTCTESGYCELCGRPNKDDPAKGHTEETIPAVDATCTSTGLTAGTKCSVCGVTLVAQTEVEMLDHNYEATVNADGSTTYTCTNGCNDSYVINNAAINGTYYDDMDTEYVFANGKLTAMGSEFTYTYNVTTGMVELQETTKVYFFVINGTLCSRTRMPLHKHDKSSLIKEITAPTCTEKGYTTYICPISGPLFNDDYVDATGHSYGSMKVEPPTCTEDGYLQITCRTCKKTFVSPSPETDAYIDSQPSFITITIKPATGHTAAEAVREKVQNATCTAAGSYESVVYCSVCDAEISRTTETITALGHTPGEEVIENKKPATSTEAGSYDKVVYCVTCNAEISRETVTVEPTCKHTNKEIIPAVLPLPSNNSTAYTEGVKCLDCGETITAQEKISVTNTPSWSIFGIGAVELILNNNISLNYKINVNSGYTIEYLAFVFEDVEYTLDEYMSIDAKGRYIFKFDKTRPHKINSTISAYVYGKTENGYVVDKYDYSVMEYCLAIINENNPAKTTVISDLLYMGAATQKYIASNNNTQLSEDELVTTIAAKLLEEQGKGYKLTPSTFTGKVGGSIPTFKDYDTSNAMWLTANVLIGSSTSFEYCFKAKNIEGLTVVVEVDGVKKLELTSDDLTIDAKGRYVAKVECITSIQYGSEVKATIMDGDVALGSISYSINEYLAYTCGESTGSKLELAKAVYNFGKSAYDLFN